MRACTQGRGRDSPIYIQNRSTICTGQETGDVRPCVWRFVVQPSRAQAVGMLPYVRTSLGQYALSDLRNAKLESPRTATAAKLWLMNVVGLVQAQRRRGTFDAVRSVMQAQEPARRLCKRMHEHVLSYLPQYIRPSVQICSQNPVLFTSALVP